MITQYRPAYFTAPRASSFAGRSIDTKPVDVANGSIYEEIDTGRTYSYDAENAVWHEYKATGAASEVKSVNGKTGNVVLGATDVGALPITGGTLTGDLYIAPEGRTNVIVAPMGSGANIVVKENDSALTMMTFSPISKSFILSDGTTSDPITVRGVAEPSGDTDAANKQYVDEYVQYAAHTIHSVSIDANGTHTEQVSVQLPTGVNSVTHEFYVSINGQNLTALCSATRTEAVSSSSGSWLRVHCLAYNPSADAISGDIVIHVLCIHK